MPTGPPPRGSLRPHRLPAGQPSLPYGLPLGVRRGVSDLLSSAFTRKSHDQAGSLPQFCGGVGTIANLLKHGLTMSLPAVIRLDQHHIFDSARPRECVLFLHVKFEISHHNVQGYVAFMMDLPSLEQLRSLVAAFLTSLNSESN